MTTSEKSKGMKAGAAGRGRGKIALRLAAGGLILLAQVWFARDAGEEIKALEAWIASHGILGPVVFMGAVVILMSVFVPSTLLAAMAGALSR